MAKYPLKYYKEIPQADGGTIRLEIHKKWEITDVPVIPIDGDITINPDLALGVEIGDVVKSLSLQIQGQQGDVDTPIVKTSLSMTFVDAPDIIDGRKNGNWDEFYTADATGWKVILKEKSAYTDLYTTIWGGYITPDSFAEDLVYHGSVSLIARDNLGHMQDFPFDAEGDADGTIKLWDLVRLGFGKIESPMSLDWYGDGQGVKWLYTEYGNPLYDTRINVSFFEGMNWYEAIEKALYSYGLVMRYVGRNRLHICPLRDMPKHGYHDYEYFGCPTPIFVSGARRELVPAVKEIRETATYDLEEDVAQPQVKTEDFTGVQTTYRCKIDGETIDGTSFSTEEHDAPVWAITPNGVWGQSEDAKTLFFDASRYEAGYFTKRQRREEEMRRYMYLAANNVDTRAVQFYKLVNPADLTIRIKFGTPIALNTAGQIEQQSVFNLYRIKYSVSINQGGTIYHYAGNGNWTTNERVLTADYDAQQNATEFEVFVRPNGDIIEGVEATYSMLCLTIHKIEYRQMGYGSLQKKGLYACIQDLAIVAPASHPLRDKNAVNTIFNEENNVVLKRDPELAPAFDAVALSGCIKNGIFDKGNYVPFPMGGVRYREGDGDTQPLQLAVHIHKQLLCYYGKPNNVISGTIVNAGTAGLSCNWLWRGKEHILMSGSLNLLNGHMEGAVLREFKRYEDMWSEGALDAMTTKAFRRIE